MRKKTKKKLDELWEYVRCREGDITKVMGRPEREFNNRREAMTKLEDNQAYVESVFGYQPQWHPKRENWRE